MNQNFKGINGSKDRQVVTLYLIGDEGADKESIYRFLQIEKQPEIQQIAIGVKQLGQNSFVEIYDFPTDKILRKAITLYFKILPSPSLILYFLKADSSEKQIWEWVRVLSENYVNARIVFVSEVESYLQREKVIVKVGKQFEYTILQNICFVVIQPASLDRMFGSIGTLGIKISSAVCLKPTLRQRLGEHWGNVVCRVKKIFRNFGKNQRQESVV